MIDLSKSKEPDRWMNIMGTLSLDMAQPHIFEMGLQLPDGKSFKAELREIIIDFRKIPQTSEATTLFLQAIQSWFSVKYDPSFLEHFFYWGKHIFQYSSEDGVSVFLWNNILQSLGLNGARDHAPPPEIIRVLRLNLKKLTLPIETIDIPLSSWDVDFYARHGYGEDFNPMDRVENTIAHKRFLEAWQNTVQSMKLSPAALGQACEWASFEAKLLGMPLQSIGTPSNWPALPAIWLKG